MVVQLAAVVTRVPQRPGPVRQVSFGPVWCLCFAERALRPRCFASPSTKVEAAAEIATLNKNYYHPATFFTWNDAVTRLVVTAALLLASLAAQAADVPEFRLVIQNHTFQPSELKVPSGAKVKLLVENRDAAPEEFESTELGREKIVLPNSTASVYVGPLKPGSYRFFGDFHQDTAQGRLIAE
ncbi:cupredoxin domain-containing protein [Dyella sp.]|jgi:plastocyanin|uniref:cupredoxin domain-containing protein n=1 Tax=Dyella sp. TaxID=1869338 RepID=UPI002D767823|nr:cupredoxin domain-containing protein [Dyella sp.]HET6431231.1 cupredoxin domain-containing protein [Dyella sp.]